MNRLVGAVGRATASGRFISRWSIVIALLISITVMAPASDDGPRSLLQPAGLFGSLCFVGALLVIGLLERRVGRPTHRAVIVALGLLVASAGRPVLQDAWLLALAANPAPGWQLPFRIATNLLVWTITLTTIAVIVDAARSLRTTNARLQAAMIALDATQERVDLGDATARAAIADTVQALRHDVEALSRGAMTVAQMGVERIRPWSHELGRLAAHTEQPGDALVSTRLPANGPDLHRRPRGGLRLPPIGVVTVLYAACLLPYASRALPLPQLLLSAAVLIAGGAITDLVPRLRAVQGTRRSLATFVGLAVAVGTALSVLASLTGAAPWLAAVPAAVYIALAVASARCVDAIHALRVERLRLSDAIRAQQRASSAGSRPARDALWEAAELLHRDGQGACTTCSIQHPHPSGPDVAALVARLDDVLDRVAQVFDHPPPGADSTSLESLVATWGRVMGVRATLGTAAVAALDAHPGLARDAYVVVAEGLLNAVKHGGAGAVNVDLAVVASGAGPQLRVRVRSPGGVGPGARLRPGSHLADLGARLRSGDDDTTLEADFPFRAAAAVRPVVSTEHPRREPTVRP